MAPRSPVISFLILLCGSLSLFAQLPKPGSSTGPTSTPAASVPAAVSPQTVAELKQLQRAALDSDYAYRQVAHLANNIGPRLSGSAQASQAVDYVSAELKNLGCEV